ncbi:MAG: gamma-glutamyltransferase [Coleofasciculaceae cyanobacterium]
MNKKTHGVVAAGNQKTAEAGIEMLRNGGNAFDAAVAASLASFVTESALTSAAGGGFLLAHTQAGNNTLFDFFTQTPRQKRNIQEIDFYPVEFNFGGAIQEFHIGLGSMAVPGNIAGLFHVHQKLGRLPLSVVAEPAIHYAQNGFKLNSFQYYCLTSIVKPVIIDERDGKQYYRPTGAVIEPETVLYQQEFADALTHLVQKGAKEFYQGEIAHQLIKDCQKLGGYLTLDDLKNYQIIERKPLLINYNGDSLLTNPPPSSGGTLIAFALKLLAKTDLNKIGFGNTNHLEILAKIMQLTNEARKDGYDANLYQESIVEKFLDEQHIEQYSQQVTNKWGSTTHISVIDSEGNAASITTTNGEGSGYVIPGTGIMVNNMLGEEDLNPQGFHQWQENVRISSMMSPAIVLKNNQPEIVLGSGGSTRIRTAILQVISNIIDFKMPVQEAVDSPRVHWENNIFHLEPGFAANVDTLTMPADPQLVQWQQKNLFFGGVHTVSKTSEGLLEGASDQRRDGGVSSC